MGNNDICQKGPRTGEKQRFAGKLSYRRQKPPASRWGSMRTDRCGELDFPTCCHFVFFKFWMLLFTWHTKKTDRNFGARSHSHSARCRGRPLSGDFSVWISVLCAIPFSQVMHAQNDGFGRYNGHGSHSIRVTSSSLQLRDTTPHRDFKKIMSSTAGTILREFGASAGCCVLSIKDIYPSEPETQTFAVAFLGRI